MFIETGQYSSISKANCLKNGLILFFLSEEGLIKEASSRMKVLSFSGLCHTIPYPTTPYHTTYTTLYHTIPYHTIPHHLYHIKPHQTTPNHTIPHHTIQHHTPKRQTCVQYSLNCDDLLQSRTSHCYQKSTGILSPELERRENISSNLEIAGDVMGWHIDLTTAC